MQAGLLLTFSYHFTQELKKDALVVAPPQAGQQGTAKHLLAMVQYAYALPLDPMSWPTCRHCAFIYYMCVWQCLGPAYDVLHVCGNSEQVTVIS